MADVHFRFSGLFSFSPGGVKKSEHVLNQDADCGFASSASLRGRHRTQAGNRDKELSALRRKVIARVLHHVY